MKQLHVDKNIQINLFDKRTQKVPQMVFFLDTLYYVCSCFLSLSYVSCVSWFGLAM